MTAQQSTVVRAASSDGGLLAGVRDERLALAFRRGLL
jgi:hypothetical protein